MEVVLKRKLMRSPTYLAFLQGVIRAQATSRGYKKTLAEIAGCQPAYLSQVLQGKAHLTPEQAERLSTYWNLDLVESDIFFQLVLLGRAGTPSLRDRLNQKLKALRHQWEKKDETFAQPALNEAEKAGIYYSNWLYSALHILLTVPSLRTVDALASHLGQEATLIDKALKRLEKIGLVIKSEKGWQVTQASVHSPESSISSESHHRNWRVQALQKADIERKAGVRYTSMHTLSGSDFQKICEILDESIRRTRAVIEPSPEELGACLIIDYFALSKI